MLPISASHRNKRLGEQLAMVGGGEGREQLGAEGFQLNLTEGIKLQHLRLYNGNALSSSRPGPFHSSSFCLLY